MKTQDCEDGYVPAFRVRVPSFYRDASANRLLFNPPLPYLRLLEEIGIATSVLTIRSLDKAG